MTLHDAIEKLLRQAGQAMSSQSIANELNKNKWYTKNDSSLIKASQITARIKNIPNYLKLIVLHLR